MMKRFPNAEPGAERSSINGRLKQLIRQMVVPFSILTVLLLLLFTVFFLRYAQVSSNITTASRFNHNFKNEVDLKMYTFVSGSRDDLPFDEVETARDLANTLLGSTANREGHRTIQSVLNLCDNLLDSMLQIRDADGYDERMRQLESNIYVITKLIEEYIYTYLYYEAGELAAIHVRLRAALAGGILAAALLIILTVMRTVRRSIGVAESITAPIDALYERVQEIGRGDLNAREPVRAEDEKLQTLSNGIEQMVEKINEQMKLYNQEQVRLRGMELALIQAQINPHFLYNTLDTIVWLIETGKTGEAEEMVVSLSTYFRSFLSNGKDIITLREEARHIRSYLEIQQVRYKDILSYQIRLDERFDQCMIPKMTLQPLVENAIYHGIKLRRGGGAILISDECDGVEITIRVRDTGMGMSDEVLAEIRAGMESDAAPGFGLVAAYKRLKLLYGERCSFVINSTVGEGTEIVIRMPYVTEVTEEI